MTPFALHLMRHGAPVRPGLMLGHTDDEPTGDGIAACVAQASDLGTEQLVCSDLRRALLPAQAIGSAAAVTPVIDPRWRELHFGDWDGKAAREIDPAALSRFWEDPDLHPPAGGERWSALVARVGRAIAEMVPATTLVVAHGGAIRAALHVLCGFEQRQLWAFELPYGVLITLRVWPAERRGDRPSAQIVGLYP